MCKNIIKEHSDLQMSINLLSPNMNQPPPPRVQTCKLDHVFIYKIQYKLQNCWPWCFERHCRFTELNHDLNTL